MKRTAIAIATATLLTCGVAIASSHREAPAITETPKVDNTDFYMFRSYEEGREGYVTLIANYLPFQDPYGGPNYYTMDEDALYGIHIDNDGDAMADLDFYFKFYKEVKGIAVPVGGLNVPVPLQNVGPFGSDRSQDVNRNVIERYAVVSVRNADHGDTHVARNLTGNRNLFVKPSDNIGNKSIPEYANYASKHIFRIAFDGCAGEGRVFVGQREEGFAVNVGEVFDLINTNPVGPRDGEINALEGKNVTSIALELPIACLTEGSPIIGAWATAHKPRPGTVDDYQIVSRLSAPLVNEVVIGLPHKDRFNGSHPYHDAQFAAYVTNPSLPELIQILYPAVTAPNMFPRTDLVAAFLTGIEGLNKPAGVRPAEMMRLNTSIAPEPAAEQDSLGVLGGDLAGFPNGRRPGDDVVDIELRVAMGALLPEDVAPSGQLPYTDGAYVDATEFMSRFPYLNVPLPGSPNEENGTLDTPVP